MASHAALGYSPRPMLSPNEQRAAFSLLLHAALADGVTTDPERSALKAMTESFAADGGATFNPWSVHQEVLAGRFPVEIAAGEITRPEAQQLVFEMVLGVCDADGGPNPAEQAFLTRARTLLKIPASPLAAETTAAALVQTVPAARAVTDHRPEGNAPTSPSARTTTQPVNQAELEKSVLNTAILNGALELLPQSLATMAIVPLQMKLVYGIGKAHGYTLDRGHIRDFIATAGAGLAAQAVEAYARKLLGGFIGKALGGGLLGGIGRSATGAATGAAVTFAATYAIGHLAIRYYGGGRTWETAVLRDTYQRLLGDGQRLFGVHQAAVQQRAATLSPQDVINLARQP